MATYSERQRIYDSREPPGYWDDSWQDDEPEESEGENDNEPD